MLNPPNSFADWQDYPLTLDPIHIAWLKNAKINPLYHPANVLNVGEIPKKYQDENVKIKIVRDFLSRFEITPAKIEIFD